ncbi:uncharacterized protein LOC131940527 [Physella acuta]|uniref:uncharacterized protein LOC131940527 n=1 Tax=Physella acuta TaxID=109671 RepID=UPI0027DD7EC0|nr:uncharacterized protein LOC131940527 [Physella acuta]
MVSIVSSQQAIYRSVPPCPVAYTLTNELDRLRDKHRSSTAPVYTNTPENFAHRFRSRPITRPKVIQFDGSSLRQRGHPLTRRYIPVVRAKVVTETTKLQSTAEHDNELPPLVDTSPRQNTTTRPPPKSPRTRRQQLSPVMMTSLKQTTSHKSHENGSAGKPHDKSYTRLPASKYQNRLKYTGAIKSADRASDHTDLLSDHIRNLHFLATSSQYDDVTALPRPQKVNPKRDLPWVYRFKVKRANNTISKIMASKPMLNKDRTILNLF